jgi:hypothetical protein
MAYYVSFPEEHAPALREIAGIVGREDIYSYTSQPTTTSERFVFQSWVDCVPGVLGVCLSRPAASANVQALLEWCRANPQQARALAGGEA